MSPFDNASSLENKFHGLWRFLGGPALTRELRFDESRRWRFDFAHESTRTAIEIEGGVFGNGRHNRGMGFIKDCEKYNAATAQGWRVFRLTSNHLKNAAHIKPIIQFINSNAKG